MESLGLILAYLAIGWVLQRTHSLPENSGLVLNQYVIHVAVPAMILLHLPSLEVSAAVLTPIFTPWAMFALAIGLVLLCSRLFKWGRDLTGAMLIVVPLGNTSFLGFPMVETFYGTSALPFAVLYDQAGSFLALALFTSVIAAHYANTQSGSKPSKKEQAVALLRFPPLIALLVALSVGQTEYPSMLQQLFEVLAATLVPVVMIAVGFQLKFKVLRADIPPFIIALSIKLLVLPLVALASFYWIGLNDVAAQVSVLEAAMPPMITAGALAMSAGLRPRLVAGIVGYGVVLGMATLPIMHWLTQQVLVA
ncbi:AEC family transporter [Aliidiomarina celeris]|uniref:AEC family transporter n=1 Tax=Aliidiomarina celeris TaxID=2249428 RepID=UPI000DE91189|nr:AEC family transporter [Aliidiomarina celeris]